MSTLSAKDRQGIGLITLVLIAAGAMIAVNMHLSARPKPDSRSCIAPISRKTVFLIDLSDAIPDQTATEIKSRVLNAVSKDVQFNELVSVFVITDTSRTQLTPIFSACKPQQSGSEITENVRTIKKRFSDNFQKPLERALATRPPQSATSPVGEAVIDLSLSDYLRAPENRMVVFSDMMQNSGNYSLYSCTDAHAAIAGFRQNRAGAMERPTFKNTDVRLNFIPREGVGRAVAACRQGFWAWFFADNEGPKAGLNSDFLPGGAKVQR
jgi:hypothetical protein